jgi:hypothetical protein
MNPIKYKIISESPITNEEWIKLFKEKELRDIIVRFLSEKKLTTIVQRGQAPSEQAEFRKGGIAMIDEIIADMTKIEEGMKEKIKKEKAPKE